MFCLCLGLDGVTRRELPALGLGPPLPALVAPPTVADLGGACGTVRKPGEAGMAFAGTAALRSAGV